MVEFVTNGQIRTVTLSPGKRLRITADAITTAIVRRTNPNGQLTGKQSQTIAANQTRNFGPFANPRTYSIEITAGATLAYDIVVPDSAGADFTALNTKIERLRMLRERARGRNVNGNLFTNVALTIGTAQNDAGMTKNWPMQGNNNKYYTASCGRLSNYGGSAVGLPVAKLDTAVGNSLANSSASSWRGKYTFYTRDTKFCFSWITASGSFPGIWNIRIRVDDRLINPAGHATPAGTAWCEVDFSLDVTAAGVRTRKITIELRGAQVINALKGYPTGSMCATKEPYPMVVIGLGDSYIQGDQPSNTAPSWFCTFADSIGATDARQMAIGGTGYFNPGAGGQRSWRYMWPGHFALNDDIDYNAVDVVLISGGVNDYNVNNANTGNVVVTPAHFTAEIIYLLGMARAQCPNALIIVTGVQGRDRNNDATTLGYENGLLAGVNQFIADNADQLVAFMPWSTAVPPWQSGTGNTSNLQANGTGDIELSNDAIHPTDIGNDAIGFRALSRYDEILAGLLTQQTWY